MKKKLSLVLIYFFFTISLTGCNTIVGATKGIVEDISDILPII